MTSTDIEGLAVGAYLEREDPRDALCGATELRPGMRIGTASIRRRAQLLALDPSLSIEPMRGNIDTRLRKRGERGLDAIVLAACGLDRLGLDAEIGRRFEPDELVPEAGQGALALAGTRRRRAARRRGGPRRDAPAGRSRARVCRDHRRRLSRTDRRAPRRRAADRSRRRRGRQLDRAQNGHRSRRGRRCADAVRRGLTCASSSRGRGRRPRSSPKPYAGRLRAGALPADRDRADRRRPDRGRRVRLGDRHERERSRASWPGVTRRFASNRSDRRSHRGGSRRARARGLLRSVRFLAGRPPRGAATAGGAGPLRGRRRAPGG